ncbi:MAG: hypothetical protein QGH65_18690, partial [SAR324 cluster bacterium]|nr:hypothetical protein [SAR324 cluster bacterium]
SQGTVKNSIKNCSDFIKYFTQYLKMAVRTNPFTKTATGNHRLASPLSTGLCIEIHDKPYDNDKEKHIFMKDPNFNFYKIKKMGKAPPFALQHAARIDERIRKNEKIL